MAWRSSPHWPDPLLLHRRWTQWRGEVEEVEHRSLSLPPLEAERVCVCVFVERQEMQWPTYCWVWRRLEVGLVGVPPGTSIVTTPP